jgi:hypothetical protein
LEDALGDAAEDAMMLQKISVHETYKVPTDVDSTIELRSLYHPDAGVVAPFCLVTSPSKPKNKSH